MRRTTICYRTPQGLTLKPGFTTRASRIPYAVQAQALKLILHLITNILYLLLVVMFANSARIVYLKRLEIGKPGEKSIDAV